MGSFPAPPAYPISHWSTELWTRNTWITIPFLSLIDCSNLGKLFGVSKASFAHMWNENDAFLLRLAVGKCHVTEGAAHPTSEPLCLPIQAALGDTFPASEQSSCQWPAHERPVAPYHLQSKIHISHLNRPSPTRICPNLSLLLSPGDKHTLNMGQALFSVFHRPAYINPYKCELGRTLIPTFLCGKWVWERQVACLWISWSLR